MPVNIIIKGGDTRQQRAAVNRIMDKLRVPDPSKAVKRIAEVWALSYRGEGNQVGGWTGLAQSTMEERARQGFNPSGPILIRQGSLYAMSTLFFAQGRRGLASGWSTYGGRSIRTTASLEITNGVATLGLSGPKTIHQKGNWTAPKRQYWFTNRVAIQATRLGVVEWIKDEVLR